MAQVLTPVARLVAGHPIERNAKTDNQNQPVLQADGSEVTETYVGLAIAKAGETHWNQTAWGQQIHAEAVAAWPNGEHGSPMFAWKIQDGDSTIPNKKGITNASREGYAGHWIINASTRLSVKAFHKGNYDPHQQIQNEKEIKRGDYCRVLLDVRSNKSNQTSGMYVNPVMFELTRAGVEIVPVGSGPAAADVFGASEAIMPTNAHIDTAVAAPAPVATPAPVAPAAPAHDLVNQHLAPPPAPAAPAPVVVKYDVGGTAYTKEQLVTAGWSEAQIDALPTV